MRRHSRFDRLTATAKFYWFRGEGLGAWTSNSLKSARLGKARRRPAFVVLDLEDGSGRGLVVSFRVVVWNPDSAESFEHFSSVLNLHKSNRSTLGPMPDTAFKDRAKHKGLLLGMRDSQVVAYVLYDIPRHNLIKLVHLCVDTSARGSGAARALVDAVIRLHPRRSMISAACRTDYGIDDFWRSLGMHAASEKPGRALNGSTLTNWVKRINIASGLDLLETASLESGLPVAVLDTNIIGDLFSLPEVRRDHREESAALQSDWLQPLVTFAVSGEVDNEISRITDENTRRHLRNASSHLTRLSTRRPTDRSIEDQMLLATDRTLLSKDASLRTDVLHVADAIHAGADYFVTNDGNLLESAQRWAMSDRRIQILRPHQLIAALTPESFMSDFHSHLIDGIDLEWRRLTEVDSALETLFRVYELEPKPAIFLRKTRELLARPDSVTVEKLVDSNDRLWALAAFEVKNGVLRLPLLRAIRGERGGTVAFQLLRHFRRMAWAKGATAVEVTDTAISTTLDAALRADGFGEEVPRGAELGPCLATASALGLGNPTDVVIAERHRWPLLVSEAHLPTFLIPIRPAWASRLLGLDDGLYSDRRRGLGLSRELVYFSASRMIPGPLPARVLWYASGDKTIQLSRIVARSIMVDAARVGAQEAVERFAKLGVFRSSDIRSSADKSGKVNVIRFQDTELLHEPVSRREAVFKRYVKGKVQSMRSVSPDFYEELLSTRVSGCSS